MVAACALCDLPVLRPLRDDAGLTFCCVSCREVYGLLASHPRTPAAEAGVQPEAAETVTTNLVLGGMWCASCLWLIGETLERAPGVTQAEVSFAQRQARITYDPGRTDPRRLAGRVRGLGYRAWLPGEKPHDEEEAMWWRLLVCGVLVFHDMLASFAIYFRDFFGLSSPDTEWMVQFFNYMSLLVAAPVILLLGLPVLRAGLASLLRGRPNIHTLIAIGAVAAFALSLRNLFAGYGRVYFETTSVLLFLVGVGHWLEIRARKAGTEAVEALLRQIPAEASLVTPDGERRVPVDEVAVGNRVRVRPGERFPSDGLVAEGQGDVDESLLTGEPHPVLRRPGERVLAGTCNLDGAFDVITTAVGAQTVAGQIGKLLHAALWQRAPVERLADRLAAWMTPAAVALALMTFAFWSWRAGAEVGLVNALSVLLIACPCALGIATPLTLWVALGRAAQAGVILRSTAALEALANARTAFFDKTGTLTRHPIRLQEVALYGANRAHGPADLLALARIAAVERLSEHPLARAVESGLVDRLAPNAPLPQATGFRALPGRGVTADVDGYRIFVGSRQLMDEQDLVAPHNLTVAATRWQAAGLSVAYAGWDGIVRAALALGETARAEASEALRATEELGVAVVVLTGDDAAAGRRWETHLGVPVLAEQRPEDKLARLRAAGAGALMVGDGINDGPALAAASVGIGMVAGAEVARAASEVILLKDDLNTIPWLIGLARQAMGKVRQNLAWAFAYNLIGLALAVSGHMQPAVAALLMVANSALVTWNGLRLRKAIGADEEDADAGGDEPAPEARLQPTTP